LSDILEELPEVTLLTGLAVVDPEVREARARAEKPAEVVDPFQGKVLPSVVFTDGSAIHPADRWMRRAAWAVAWYEPGIGWQEFSCATEGSQTVSRSELAAALWAARKAGDDLEVVSDSAYVVDGCKKLRAGHGRHLFEGPDGDLWRQMHEAGVPKLTWVPPTSHRSKPRRAGSRTSTGSATGRRTRRRRPGRWPESPPRG
jgi:Ribonuclease HI